PRCTLSQHQPAKDYARQGNKRLIPFTRRRDSVSLEKSYLPPKKRLNDLNKRPGKVGAFGAPFGACCANGHCEPPCTWQATVGILSTGKSMSYAEPAAVQPVVAS